MVKEFQIEIDATQYESLSDGDKEYYEESGDKYIATSLSPLLSSLEQLKKKRDAFTGMNPEEAKKALELSKTIDFDIDKARAALEQQKRIEHEELIEKGDFDAARKKIQDEADAKVQTAESRVSKVVEGFGRKELELRLRNAGVKDEDSDLVVFDVLDKYVEIKEKEGEVRFVNKDGVGDSVDFNKLISGLKETRSGNFKSEQIPGSGANGNGNSGGAASGKKFADLTPTEKTDAIREHGGYAAAQEHYQ